VNELIKRRIMLMKVAVIYWSGSGNTQLMADAIAQGIMQAGADARVFNVAEFEVSQLDEFDRFAFGCPSMGQEVLEENEFEPLFAKVESLLFSKRVLLFGSYGWGDGLWMREWVSRARRLGIELISEGLIVHETPNTEDVMSCIQAGAELGSMK